MGNLEETKNYVSGLENSYIKQQLSEVYRHFGRLLREKRDFPTNFNFVWRSQPMMSFTWEHAHARFILYVHYSKSKLSLIYIYHFKLFGNWDRYGWIQRPGAPYEPSNPPTLIVTFFRLCHRPCCQKLTSMFGRKSFKRQRILQGFLCFIKNNTTHWKDKTLPV